MSIPLLPKDPPVLGSSRVVAITPGKIETGFDYLDLSVLSGGFGVGQISEICGTIEAGKYLIAFHTLISCLIMDQKQQAAIIDSTGIFSPVQLHNIVLKRLKSLRSIQRECLGLGDGSLENLKDETNQILDRVQVMRTFGLQGIVDAVGELMRRARIITFDGDINSNFPLGILIIDSIGNEVGQIIKQSYVQ
ncbi:MAG: hypothetical protein M1829_001849, partial [Trizodia sp. TS-e1964]